MLRTVLAACVVLLVPAAASSSSILVNGSFEASSGMPGNGEVGAGSTAITGWVVSGSSPNGDVVDWIGPGGAGPTWLVSDGSHAIDLDGRDSLGGTVSQTFATVVGQLYTVDFDLSGNPGDPGNAGLPMVKSMQASVAGITNFYQFDVTGLTTSTLVWRTISFTFLATAQASTLSFTSLTGQPNSYGALIDNVSVQQASVVPEPATAVLCATGVLVLLLGRKRRTRGARQA